MWLKTRAFAHRTSTYSQRTSRFVDRDFQLKYTSVIVFAAVIGMLLSVLPIYYFHNQNYEIFMNLAYQTAPELLDHLEREQIWVKSILSAGFVGITFFFSILGFRMTSRIVGPVRVLKNHLRLLSRGHWEQSPIRVRDHDEFQDLIDSYNYFYKCFRQNMRRDLDLLNALSVDPSNRDAYKAWKALIEEKSLQLNPHHHIPKLIEHLTWSDEVSGPDRDSRRVS